MQPPGQAQDLGQQITAAAKSAPQGWEVAHTLDACGLLCPEPVMLLHRHVAQIRSGQVLRMLATDPSTRRDVPRFCTFLGHQLLKHEEQQEHYCYYIRKG